MQLNSLFAAVTVVTLSACSSMSTGSAPAPAPTPTPAAAPAPSAQAAQAANTQKVKSRDGKLEGEIIGKPAANSKFAKLAIGMETEEVQKVLGRAPDRSHSYESGKRWIPFYFGSDARRMQVLYRSEGCLVFTGGNVWGAAGGELIQIQVDTAGACYQP